MNTKVFTKGSKTYFLSFVRSVVEKNLTTKNIKVFTKDSKTFFVNFVRVHFVRSVVEEK